MSLLCIQHKNHSISKNFQKTVSIEPLSSNPEFKTSKIHYHSNSNVTSIKTSETQNFFLLPLFKVSFSTFNLSSYLFVFKKIEILSRANIFYSNQKKCEKYQVFFIKQISFGFMFQTIKTSKN